LGLIIHSRALAQVHEGSDMSGTPVYSYRKALRIAIQDDIKIVYNHYKESLAQ